MARGAGKDVAESGQWNRFNIVTKELTKLGLKTFIEKENIKNKKNMKLLWKKRLQRQ